MDEATRPDEDLRGVLLEAAQLSEDDRDAEALELLLEAEPSHPEDATLLCMIGALAGHLGADGMAADFFNRCLSQTPTDPQILVTAGAGLAALGDPAAEPALRLAAVTHPDLAAARMHYGALLVRSGLTEQGIDELLAARDLDPGDAAIRRELGTAFLQASRREDALAELEITVDLAPDDFDARALWVLALVECRELDRAAEEGHPLVEPLEMDGPFQLLLALLFLTAGWEEEAWLAVSRAESGEGVDTAAVREVEEAIEAGEESSKRLLLEELAPSLLRERIFLA